MRQLRRSLQSSILFCAAGSMALSAETFITLFSFDHFSTGSAPVGPLVQGTDGNLYGAVQEGGASGDGNIFKITPSGEFSILYGFSGPDGAGPNPIILGSDGNFYGTTSGGGTDNQGTLFRLTAEGTLTTLHTFSSSEGFTPVGSLVFGFDGRLYGTESSEFDGVLIFTISAAGDFTTLKTTAPGVFSVGPPTLGYDGDFYGAGQVGLGSIYRMTPEGVVTVLHTFSGLDGETPQGVLTLGDDGNFYGETAVGGSPGSVGTLFKITPAGIFTSLYDFQTGLYGPDGALPGGGMVLGEDGFFYGQTQSGGASLYGTIFRFDGNSSLTTLHNFYVGADVPPNELTQSTTGAFYGTTYGGGTAGWGSIFTFSLGLPPFVSLNPGAGPVGQKVQMLGQGFTGTTAVSFNGTPAIFEVISDGVLKTTVPAGAQTGRVEVMTSSGELKSKRAFVVTP